MQDKPTIIDVRSYGEFMGGHVAGSINIPLQEITQRLDEIKALPKPVILCCASGNRSGQDQRQHEHDAKAHPRHTGRACGSRWRVNRPSSLA